jgi:DNA-directed RNA polymerase specialized sigma24 family protein
VETGQQTAYDGLLRAARLAASIAGASGAEVEEVAEEAVARLLMQDGLVNNPKAWVRRTAGQLTAQAHARRRIQTAEVLRDLTATERTLVLAQRSGHTLRDVAESLGITEDAARLGVAEANRKVRRSSRRLGGASD